MSGDLGEGLGRQGLSLHGILSVSRCKSMTVHLNSYLEGGENGIGLKL